MAGERRGTPWPWLLVPILALIVYFGLRSCKEDPTATQGAVVTQSTAVTGL